MQCQDHNLSVYNGFGMLRQRITGQFKQFGEKTKLLVRGYAGGIKWQASLLFIIYQEIDSTAWTVQ